MITDLFLSVLEGHERVGDEREGIVIVGETSRGRRHSKVAGGWYPAQLRDVLKLGTYFVIVVGDTHSLVNPNL